MKSNTNANQSTFSFSCATALNCASFLTDQLFSSVPDAATNPNNLIISAANDVNEGVYRFLAFGDTSSISPELQKSVTQMKSFVQNHSSEDICRNPELEHVRHQYSYHFLKDTLKQMDLHYSLRFPCYAQLVINSNGPLALNFDLTDPDNQFAYLKQAETAVSSCIAQKELPENLSAVANNVNWPTDGYMRKFIQSYSQKANTNQKEEKTNRNVTSFAKLISITSTQKSFKTTQSVPDPIHKTDLLMK